MGYSHFIRTIQLVIEIRMPASTVSCEDMHLLINMGLGEPISGEVNFKHLHTLLHEIVNKLEVKEGTTAATEEVITSEEIDDKVPSQSSTPTPQKYRDCYRISLYNLPRVYFVHLEPPTIIRIGDFPKLTVVHFLYMKFKLIINMFNCKVTTNLCNTVDIVF